MAEQQAAPTGSITLRPFQPQHRAQVVALYNHYVRTGTAAFPPEPVPQDFFDFLLELPGRYPVLVLWEQDPGRVVGFCFLSPYHPMPTFAETALIDYFIAPGYTGRGLGALCLQRLEQAARAAGISHIIADISTENQGSIAFHERHGFRHCGVLQRIGHKLGRDFGVVHMQKDLPSVYPTEKGNQLP